MLENRSFDHMLGFLYTDQGNASPAGHPFDDLTGRSSNPDDHGQAVRVFPIKTSQAYAYFMPGADPGEGYAATNMQLFGTIQAPVPPTATLAVPRADDPLTGVQAPTAKEANPAASAPSHLQRAYAELVAQLPIPDAQGGAHHEMPPCTPARMTSPPFWNGRQLGKLPEIHGNIPSMWPCSRVFVDMTGVADYVAAASQRRARSPDGDWGMKTVCSRSQSAATAPRGVRGLEGSMFRRKCRTQSGSSEAGIGLASA